MTEPDVELENNVHRAFVELSLALRLHWAWVSARESAGALSRLAIEAARAISDPRRRVHAPALPDGDRSLHAIASDLALRARDLPRGVRTLGNVRADELLALAEFVLTQGDP